MSSDLTFLRVFPGLPLASASDVILGITMEKRTDWAAHPVYDCNGRVIYANSGLKCGN